MYKGCAAAAGIQKVQLLLYSWLNRVLQPTFDKIENGQDRLSRRNQSETFYSKIRTNSTNSVLNLFLLVRHALNYSLSRQFRLTSMSGWHIKARLRFQLQYMGANPTQFSLLLWKAYVLPIDSLLKPHPQGFIMQTMTVIPILIQPSKIFRHLLKLSWFFNLGFTPHTSLFFPIIYCS